MLKFKVAFILTFSIMITSITGAGRSASIAYTDGCISTITDENGNRRTFTYDEQHRLISGTDGNNSTYVENEYDETGRVIKQTDANGGEITFAYKETDGITTVTITDALDNEQSLKVNYSGRILHVINANGSETGYSYDEKGQLTDQVDHNGNHVRNEYDEAGNIVCIMDTAGITTYMSYDERGNVIRVEKLIVISLRN